MKQIINDMKSNKLLAIMYTFSFVILAIIIISVTYAYFESQSLDSGIADVDAEFSTLDEYLITGGSPLSLNVTPTNIPEEGSNQVATTTAQVSLKKNPAKTIDLTKEYYVYFKITNNYFTRTNPLKPEIVLNVYLNNQEVTITGLTQVTEGTVTGYDITEESGLITIAAPQTITSTSSDTATVQNWEFKVTYLNLDNDQSANIGASINGEIIIQKDEIVRQIVYRRNSIGVPLGSSIIPRTGTQWVATDGTNDHASFETQAECLAALASIGNPPSFSCQEREGTFGGIGAYETSPNSFRTQTDNVYCPIGENYPTCTNKYYYYTEQECLDAVDDILAINGYTCTAGTITRPYYLKHIVDDNIVFSTEACFYYNNAEFCMEPNYRVETGNGGNNHESEENGMATMNKLKTDMETAFGMTADICYSHSNSAACDFGNGTFYCIASSLGSIGCYTRGIKNHGCGSLSNGASICDFDVSLVDW